VFGGDIRSGLYPGKIDPLYFMSSITVNKDKCGGDGKCAVVCPLQILKIDRVSRLPVMIEWGEKACIKCGHCVAVCPSGALSLADMPAASCPTLRSDWRVGPERIEPFLKGRRSIRVYKDEAVEKQTIEKLIDIASYAPSGINRQPVCWAVLYDTQKVRQMAELTIEWMRSLVKSASPLAAALHMENIIKAWDEGHDWICRGAPHLILTYSLKDDMTAPQACTIALTYMELAAASYGLGACWAGYVHMAVNMSDDARRLAGLSKRTSCFGAMLIGHSKFDYHRIPLRNKPHATWR